MRQVVEKRNMCRILPVLVLVAVSAVKTGHAWGAASPAPNAELSPAMQAAIQDLSSDEFDTRKKALAKLESAMAQQAVAIAAVEDPESSGSLVEALEFNEGLTRFLIEWQSLPKEQRDAELGMMARPELLPLLAKVFSANPAQRVNGVKAIDKSNVPGVEAFLAHLVHSSTDRGEALAAMEALWDRKPTPAVVDALWNRAVPMSLAAESWHEIYREDAYHFRGKPLAGTLPGRGREITDGDIAADLLAHLHETYPDLTGGISEKLQKMIKDAAAAADRYATNHAPDDAWYGSDAMSNVYRLIDAYKPADVSVPLYAIALSSTEAVNPRTVGEGNNQASWCKVSTRMSAMATLLLLHDQKPEAFGMVHLPGWNLWGVPASQKEATATEALTKWWQAAGKGNAGQ